MNNKDATDLKEYLLSHFGKDVVNCFHQSSMLSVSFKIETNPAEDAKKIMEHLNSLGIETIPGSAVGILKNPHGAGLEKSPEELKTMEEAGYKMFTGPLKEVKDAVPLGNGTITSNYEHDGMGAASLIPGLDMDEPDA